jgi:gluconolactonase
VGTAGAGLTMDIDLATPEFAHVVAADAPLDIIAHGLLFGEGPVWDKRSGWLYWVDIIGSTIWKWKPGVGKEVVMKPSGHANGMTFDREGRLNVAGWCNRTIFRFEHDSSITTIASHFDGKKFNSPNDIVVKSDGSVWWTDSAGGLAIPGMVAEDVQRYLDVMGVFRLSRRTRSSSMSTTRGTRSFACSTCTMTGPSGRVGCSTR